MSLPPPTPSDATLGGVRVTPRGELHLNYAPHTLADIARMLEALPADESVLSLQLSHGDLCDEAVAQLCSALKRNRSVRSVVVCGHPRTTGRIYELFAGVLGENRSISHLHAGAGDGSEASEDVRARIDAGLRRNHLAEQIRFAAEDPGVLYDITLDDRYGDAEAVLLADALAQNKQGAKQLRVTSTNITEVGARALAGALRRNDKLTSLSCYAGKYGRAGYLALADMLAVNRSLQRVVFEKAELGDDVVAAIAGALTSSAALKELSLGDCGFGVGGVRAVAALIGNHPSIHELFLSNNDLGDDGVRALAPALATNKSLWKVYLCSNGIGPAGMEELATGLEDNSSIQGMPLDGNTRGYRGAARFRILQALKRNSRAARKGNAGQAVTQAEGRLARPRSARSHPAGQEEAAKEPAGRGRKRAGREAGEGGEGGRRGRDAREGGEEGRRVLDNGSGHP